MLTHEFILNVRTIKNDLDIYSIGEGRYGRYQHVLQNKAGKIRIAGSEVQTTPPKRYLHYKHWATFDRYDEKWIK